MSKFDNRIYLTICEVSLECFKRSKFISYVNYCYDMGLSLKTNTVNKSQTRNLEEIIEMLDKIYSMDAEMTGNYLLNYFTSDNVREFEKCVVLTQESFPDLI
jgi:hypothetical protein